MTSQGRSALRPAAWALAFALWCLLWPAAIIATTWSLPGFMTLRGQGGLAEVVRMQVPLPLWATALAIGAFAFAAMWALLLLRRRCDPEGDAIAAVRWSFGSRSLNALIVVALVSVPLAMMGSIDGTAAWIGRFDVGLARFFVAWWWLILLVLVAAAMLAMPFFLLNPDTLARERLRRWWQPYWPGVIAVVLMLLYGLVSVFLSIVYTASPRHPGIWVWPLDAIGEVALSALQLAVLGVWLNRTRSSPAAALVRAFRRDAIRRWVSLELFWFALVAVMAVPVLCLNIFQEFFAPQYSVWARAGVIEIPPALQVLMSLADSAILHDGVVAPLSLCLGLYVLVSAGRLLVRLGSGAPPAGEAGAPAET